MSSESRLHGLEERARKQRKRVQAHVILKPGEQVSEHTACHFWRASGELVHTTKGEFEKAYPSGEVIILRLAYESKPINLDGG